VTNTTQVGNETADPKSVFHAADANQLGRAKKWHSQVGQDKTVALLTKGKPGYFVDLAANDAKSLSNTLTLERDFGWRGVCIEPNPRYWHGLLRRQCVHVAAAVGRTENEVMSFNFGRGATGGLIGTHFDNRPGRPNLRGEGLTEIHTVPLLQIFQHVRVPQVIDYMSFDVEGAESFIGTVAPAWDLFLDGRRLEETQLAGLPLGVLHRQAHDGRAPQAGPARSPQDACGPA